MVRVRSAVLAAAALLLLSGCVKLDVDLKVAANDLAKTVNADVVQVIGRTVTLYRENPDLERKRDLPAWRR